MSACRCRLATRAIAFLNGLYLILRYDSSSTALPTEVVLGKPISTGSRSRATKSIGLQTISSPHKILISAYLSRLTPDWRSLCFTL